MFFTTGKPNMDVRQSSFFYIQPLPFDGCDFDFKLLLQFRLLVGLETHKCHSMGGKQSVLLREFQLFFCRRKSQHIFYNF